MTAALLAIANRDYDLIVIGGGINGAGVARDAALRGLKTLLLEKGDFGGGTSSWSTRLIHGGLRYLEYFEFALVRESLHEREILLRNAPHLVKPLLLSIPLYRNGSRQVWEIQAGMILYDLLSYDKSLPNHRMLSVATTRALLRSLRDQELQGAAQYYDAQVEYAERLCLETVQSAAAAGADVFNYTAVKAIRCEPGQGKQGRIVGLSCRDELLGTEVLVTVGEQTVVVNTSGPWVDQVCGLGRTADETVALTAKRLVGGTKGSHIVVDPFPGAPQDALYVEAHKDGRPFFIVPWLGQYLIGTTDFRYDGPLDHIKASNDEIDYLIAETNHVVPTANLTRQSVCFTYSGVRPLPYKDAGAAGSISRNHIIRDHSSDGIENLISLIGGKLTTHRNSSREIVEAVYRKRRQTVPPCRTASTPLPGAPTATLWADLRDRYGDTLTSAQLAYLISVYGEQARSVLALADDSPDLCRPLLDGRLEIRAQVVYGWQSEYARTLVDFTRRRTVLAMQTHYGEAVLPAICDVLQRYCGWDAADCERGILMHRAFMTANCLPDFCGQDTGQDATATTETQHV